MKGFFFFLFVLILGSLLSVFFVGNRILVRFDHPLEPTANIALGGIECKCLIDLGCTPQLVLKDAIIEKIHGKTEIEPAAIADLKGNIYSSSRFKLPFARLGNFEFRQLEMLKDNNEFYSNIQLGSSSKSATKAKAKSRIDRLDGKIGWRFFESHDCFIDFPNSSIRLWKKGSARNLKFLKNYVRIPFIVNELGIALLVETDLGIHKMILDTGASFSVIKKSIVAQTHLKEVNPGDKDWYFPAAKLILDNCNFGSWDFACFDIADDWEIDGCIGADFFLEHAVYLDFANQQAYIRRPEKFVISTQWKRLKHKILQGVRAIW